MQIECLEQRKLLSTGAGALDQSFGDHGVLETRFGTEVKINDLAVQKDGRMVMVGITDQFGSKADFFLARRNGDGSIDKSFGKNGIATLSFLGGIEEASAVAIQSDGKIVVAGGAKKLFAVARFNTNGKLDTSFGNGGTKLMNFGKASSVAQAMTLQSDGKILIVGGSNVVRLTTKRTLDKTFSKDGKASLGDVFGDAGTVAVNPKDGAIVVGGSQASATDEAAAGVIVRLKSNGDIDPNFAKRFVAGGNTNEIGASSKAGYLLFGNELPNSVKIAGDGRIVLAGFRNLDDHTIGEVFRINEDGSAMKLLGNADTDTAQDISANDVFIQSDGSIVAAFEMWDGAGRIGLARFKPDGSRDMNFGYQGLAQTDSLTVTHDDFLPVAIAQGPGSELVVLSQSDLFTTLQRYDAGNTAFKPDFTLTNGKLNVQGTSGDDHVVAFVDEDSPLQSSLRMNNEFFSIHPNSFGTIHGGAGDDTLVALSFSSDPVLPDGTMAVQIFGDDGDDSIDGFVADGGAILYGGKGNDTISASSQSDSIFGDDGNDSILAAEGNDTIDGGKGRDYLLGEDGNDSFFAKDGEADSIFGGEGNDKAKVDLSLDHVADVESKS